MDAYEPLELIGSGSFGVIRKVRRKSDQKVLACKEIDYRKMSEKEKKQLVSEVNILRELRHPNIVRYYERYVDRENCLIYILMEYCEGGDLAAIIKRCKSEEKRIPEDIIWNLFVQLLHAVNECHHGRAHPPILHRDIKPDNVFLDAAQNVKLGDFGLSRVIDSPENGYAQTYVGTPFYMSPELVNESCYNIKSDIWALGCLIFELCALEPPFQANTQTGLAMKIRQGIVPDLPAPYSSDLNRTVKTMLRISHHKRPNASDFLATDRVRIFVKEHELSKIHLDVKRREEQLRKREQALAAREADLDAREARLIDRENRFTTHRPTGASTAASTATEVTAAAASSASTGATYAADAAAASHRSGYAYDHDHDVSPLLRRMPQALPLPSPADSPPRGTLAIATPTPTSDAGTSSMPAPAALPSQRHLITPSKSQPRDRSDPASATSLSPVPTPSSSSKPLLPAPEGMMHLGLTRGSPAKPMVLARRSSSPSDEPGRTRSRDVKAPSPGPTAAAAAAAVAAAAAPRSPGRPHSAIHTSPFHHFTATPSSAAPSAAAAATAGLHHGGPPASIAASSPAARPSPTMGSPRRMKTLSAMPSLPSVRATLERIGRSGQTRRDPVLGPSPGPSPTLGHGGLPLAPSLGSAAALPLPLPLAPAPASASAPTSAPALAPMPPPVPPAPVAGVHERTSAYFPNEGSAGPVSPIKQRSVASGNTPSTRTFLGLPSFAARGPRKLGGALASRRHEDAFRNPFQAAPAGAAADAAESSMLPPASRV